MQRIQSGKRHSNAVITNGLIFSSGLATQHPGSSVGEQTAEILAQIDDLLEEIKSGRELLVRVDIALADITDYQHMNAQWDKWLAQSDALPPARTCIEARAAAKDYFLEISFIAATK
ncbi:Rid family hydrolase [Maritalea sp.]|uniref:Rid family hydrolase n=1 Tax=Maritalea sp. TaxID=2003361 RepID=UPI003EF8647A